MITDYSSLQSAVAAWMHRTGDATVTAVIPDAIAMVERDLNGRMKARAMEVRTNLTCTAGDAYVTLPADVVDVRRVLLSSTTPQRALVYRSPDQITQSFPYADAGEPRVYTVIDGSIQFAPIPDSAYTVGLTYVQQLPALSGTNTTNWLLTAHPEIYLYGTLLYMMPFVNQPERIAEFKSFYQEAVDALNTTDWYTGTTMTVRAA